MWLERPSSQVVVVRVVGDLDMVTTPQLTELLMPRLDAFLDRVVLDLSRVSFLGTQALRMFVEVQQVAHTRGLTLRLVTGPPCVDRALRASGLSDHFDTYPALGLATSEVVSPSESPRC